MIPIESSFKDLFTMAHMAPIPPRPSKDLPHEQHWASERFCAGNRAHPKALRTHVLKFLA